MFCNITVLSETVPAAANPNLNRLVAISSELSRQLEQHYNSIPITPTIMIDPVSNDRRRILNLRYHPPCSPYYIPPFRHLRCFLQVSTAITADPLGPFEVSQHSIIPIISYSQDNYRQVPHLHPVMRGLPLGGCGYVGQAESLPVVDFGRGVGMLCGTFHGEPIPIPRAPDA